MDSIKFEGIPDKSNVVMNILWVVWLDSQHYCHCLRSCRQGAEWFYGATGLLFAFTYSLSDQYLIRF